MSQSDRHIKLVSYMIDWIADQYLGGNTKLILSDLPQADTSGKPLKIKGYIPDLLLPDLSGNPIIVGEAKTGVDLQTTRSYNQMLSFLEWCHQFDNSLFVLAVPWDLYKLGQSILSRMKYRHSLEKVDTIVLEKLIV